MYQRNEELTFEHLVEALIESRGFVLGAKKYIKKKFSYDVGYAIIKSRINEWGMQEWLDDLRRSLVEDCMKKAFHKGISEGDNHCIFWVLEKYGHHVDFLDGKDSETESKKGWKVLLDYIKTAPESEANTEC
jgi:hypothetical protein